LNEMSDSLDAFIAMMPRGSPFTMAGDSAPLISASLKLIIMIIQLAADKNEEPAMDSD